MGRESNRTRQIETRGIAKIIPETPLNHLGPARRMQIEPKAKNAVRSSDTSPHRETR
jgi:hypothetical protein